MQLFIVTIRSPFVADIEIVDRLIVHATSDLDAAAHVGANLKELPEDIIKIEIEPVNGRIVTASFDKIYEEIYFHVSE